MSGHPPLSVFESEARRHSQPPSWGIVIFGIIITLGLLVLEFPWPGIAIAAFFTFVLLVLALVGRKKTLRCELCGRRMQKLETGKGYMKGYIIIEKQAMKKGEGPAEECQECGRVYCWDCYPAMPRKCACGKRTLKLIKVRYLN